MKEKRMSTDYNASEIDRLVREYQDRGRDFTRRGGTWLGAVRSWIKRHCLNGERVTWGSNDVLRHDFTVDDVERLALEAATAVFDEFAAMVAALSAAKAEVERLTIALDQAREMSGIKQWAEDVKLSCKYAAERDRLAAGVERLTKERDRLRGATEAQGKLLAELPPSADQLIMAEMAAATARAERDAANAASRRLSARVRELELREEDREALELARKHLDCSSWMIHRRHDPIVQQHIAECDRALALLDRLVKGGR